MARSVLRTFLSIAFALAGTAWTMATERGAYSIVRDLSMEKRVALVVGNSAYEHVLPLENPANDAADMAELLKSLGFSVVEGYNLTRAGMAERLVEFNDAARDAGVVLFYYAGHGIQVSGRNHLLPVDAELQNEVAVSMQTIALDTILGNLANQDRIAIAFLDACRDNPLARRAVSRSIGAERGLAVPETGGGVMIGFATAPGETAADGDGRNSPFAEALLRHLATPGMEISLTMKRVMADVSMATGGRQRPWVHSDISSEFFMVPDGSRGPAGVQGPAMAEGRKTAAVDEGARRLQSTAPRTMAFSESFGVFEDQEFDLCGYSDFTAAKSGSNSVSLSSSDRSVPGRSFRGYQRRVPLGDAIDLFDGCIVEIEYDDSAGVGRLQFNVSGGSRE